MARCYYLDYISKGCLSSYDNDEYVCKLCGKHFATNDPQVKYTCNPDYGEEYQRCPVYRVCCSIKRSRVCTGAVALFFLYSPLTAL